MNQFRATITPGSVECRSVCTVRIYIKSPRRVDPSGGFFFFIDIRQDAGCPQTEDEAGGNYMTAAPAGGGRARVTVFPGTVRTLDLHPEVPEFLTGGYVELPDGADEDEEIRIVVTDWQTPLRPIAAFHWFIVADEEGTLRFEPTGYRSYRIFQTPDGTRVHHDRLMQQFTAAPMRATGEYRSVPEANLRKTPGVYWGELHGMAFNQRPLDDFYRYAKDVTQLDFCAAVRFSYNTCVGEVWRQVKDAAARHTEPGRFVAFAAFECGTPPDDSHRVAIFPEPAAVPPIFCETRPPALDPGLTERLHRDTVFCRTLEEYYEAVHTHGGFVTGHYHTLTYRDEISFEIWQKQSFKGKWQETKRSQDEEQNLYAYLREGKTFAVVGGSDTHDSMPGNPYPEPGCPRPAGFTGVYAERLDTFSIAEALQAGRVFATSGTRMVLGFNAGEESPMGSRLPLNAERRFTLSVDGTDDVAWIGLVKNGSIAAEWTPNERAVSLEFRNNAATLEPAFYLMKVRQRDGHLGWSSPIRFG